VINSKAIIEGSRPVVALRSAKCSLLYVLQLRVLDRLLKGNGARISRLNHTLLRARHFPASSHPTPLNIPVVDFSRVDVGLDVVEEYNGCAHRHGSGRSRRCGMREIGKISIS
jgi:hypothetical protein